MFDSLTAAALADELAREIEGGRVQQVGHVDRDSIWLEIYRGHRRHHLIASASHSLPAVYLTEQEPVWDRQWVSPLLLLLRKYVRGSRLLSIQNPPLERVLEFTFARRLTPPVSADANVLKESPVEDGVDTDGDDDEVDVDLIYTTLNVEIMGRHSNLILVDNDGRIMESVRRVTPTMSRVRPIAPKLPYVPPPLRTGNDPRRATEMSMNDLLAANSDDAILARRLIAGWRGVSPQAAREVIYRARADETELAPANLARELRHLFEPMLINSWDPTVYRDEDGVVVAYDAQPMTHLEVEYTAEHVPSVSAAIRSFDAPPADSGAGRHAVRVRKLRSQIEAAMAKLASREASLLVEERRHGDRDIRRQWGELIYGYGWTIKPGDTELVVDDVTVPLDPRVEPRELAKQYLSDYRVGKNSDDRIDSARAEIANERAWLEQFGLLVDQALAIQDIENLEVEWVDHSGSPDPRRPIRRSSPPKRLQPTATINGNLIYVGHSSKENDALTFDLAKPTDTWLHARGVPGSHVIVRWLGTVSGDDATLERAAELAALVFRCTEQRKC